MNINDKIKFLVTLETSDAKIEEDIDEKLMIADPSTISTKKLTNMMAEISAIHARWNVLYFKARHDYEIALVKFDVWSARQFLETKKNLINTLNAKAATDKATSNAIVSSQKYLEFKSKIAKLKQNMDNIKAIANGFGEKSEKLDSIAAMLKFEARHDKSRVGEYDESEDTDYINKETSHDISNNDGWTN
ncbi:MAG: hypothetical protein WC934_11815 [Acidithiobacillus sp.]|jgi:hypothetical protein|uniref:hypothetical protein n=1 Tax=Acidithiobacillus sp. TaxID=1872118 RepID=UPI003560D24C